MEHEGNKFIEPSLTKETLKGGQVVDQTNWAETGWLSAALWVLRPELVSWWSSGKTN